MRKKINYCEMSSLGGVLDSFLKESNLKQGLKKTTLFKFWPKIVGKKFEDVSKIYGITQNDVLVVACANSFVTSELTMFKPTLLKKIRQYAQPLDIEIADINFSHKIWQNSFGVEQIQEEVKDPNKPDLTGFNPDEIELDENEVAAIKSSVEKNTFASLQQRENMFNTIILDLKIQKFLAQKNQ